MTIAVQGDVSKQEDIVRLFAETKQAYGKLDILVNNAGIYEFAPLEAITAEHFHKQFNLNVLGLLLTTQEAVKHIGPDGGSIINISSIVGPMPSPTGSVYSATKAAVDAITVALAGEFGARKIRVNSLNPGMVETEGLHSAGMAEGDFRKMMESRNTARTHRPARGHRPRRRLHGLRRLWLGEWPITAARRRPAPVSPSVSTLIPRPFAWSSSCELRRQNRLPQVALCVLRKMDDQSADARRQLLPAHITRLGISARIDRAHHGLGRIELRIHRFQ